MQFITNGPDIPDALLRAHEEGNVVFFCGAGISYPAGLPDFKGLVKSVYELSGTVPSEIEQEALNRGQFDAALDRLEQRLPGQRLAVRRSLVRALKPKLRLRGATDTHSALLTLARSREGTLRLVTTNFDRVFHSAAKRTREKFHSYAAPMLPIPKNSRWDGLVYLHGLLPEKAEDTSLHRLVVSSGDFGLAYLIERWAARFVSELFRNYVVCFIGYSINDPVLRYMMDALAADRMLGEVTPQAWALGDCKPGQEDKKTNEWKAKGVTPILYEVPPNSDDHSALHRTLQVWAETYRDGALGKERIVASHALVKPSASTRQDDFVGRVLWALSDKSGLPAKRFADFNPVPSLDWLLEAFSLKRFEHSDLARFGVSPNAETDDKLRFSLIQRPSPYHLAPSMGLIPSGPNSAQWDNVMFNIARWLVRHLNDPRLIVWAGQNGGRLHGQWRQLIERELDRFAKLEREGKISELEDIRAQAPNAIPSPLLLPLWRLVLAGRVKPYWNESNLYRWKERLQAEGVTAALKIELRELLAPKLILREPFRWGEEGSRTKEPTKINQLVSWELGLNTPHIKSAIGNKSEEYWVLALPFLLEDFQQLLRDALDLMSDLADADSKSDESYWHMPSIVHHWQNRGFREWVVLIEFLRDAWIQVLRTNKARAIRIAHDWFEQPYPTFKRLAFFAASHDGVIQSDIWVEWLLVDGAWWLWSINIRREVCRLLVLQGDRLNGTVQERLEEALLRGPPRQMYRSDIETDRWVDLVDHSVWLYLAKLASSGLKLGRSAAEHLAELSKAHPEWKLADNERDEFSHWMSGTGDPDFVDRRSVDVAPRKRKELVEWLKKTNLQQSFYGEDTWRDVCRTRFSRSLLVLCDLAEQNIWPAQRWNEALQVWSEGSLVTRSWKYAAPLVQKIPESTLQEVINGLSWWLESASKSISQHEGILLELCRRILTMPLSAGAGILRDGDPIDEPVTEAINHPVGHATNALLNLWFSRELNDNTQLPPEIRTTFIKICDVGVERFIFGRVLLGTQLIALYRVDPDWAKEYLLPLFDWKNAREAKAIWQGFLWSPRLYKPLLRALKDAFLETASHYEKLGEHRQQFSSLLTYAALEITEEITVSEFRLAFEKLPREGLEQSAQALSQALETAEGQTESYWTNRVQPFWRQIWPKSLELKTSGIAEDLARLCIAARSEFPAALDMLKDWLQPIEYLDAVIHLLQESGLCNRFPRHALSMLSAIVSNQQWAPRELKTCLDAIGKSAPELLQDSAYRRLLAFSVNRGI